MRKRNSHKKLLLIILSIVFPVLAAGGFCVYWFVFHQSPVDKEISLTIDGDETINFKSDRKTTTIKLDAKGIDLNKINIEKSDDIPTEFGLKWSDFLIVNHSPEENANTNGSLIINISFLEEIPSTEFSSFKLYLQAVSNNVYSNKITINVFLDKQNLNKVFTTVDLQEFNFLPNQSEILAKAIHLNQERYDPSEFDGESLIVNLVTETTATLICENDDLWEGTVNLSWTIKLNNPIDVNTIVTETDLSEDGTFIFAEWPKYQDIVWRVETLNINADHNEEWFSRDFWPYVNVVIAPENISSTATITGTGIYWSNVVTLTFMIEKE